MVSLYIGKICFHLTAVARLTYKGTLLSRWNSGVIFKKTLDSDNHFDIMDIFRDRAFNLDERPLSGDSDR